MIMIDCETGTSAAPGFVPEKSSNSDQVYCVHLKSPPLSWKSQQLLDMFNSHKGFWLGKDSEVQRWNDNPD